MCNNNRIFALIKSTDQWKEQLYTLKLMDSTTISARLHQSMTFLRLNNSASAMEASAIMDWAKKSRTKTQDVSSAKES